MFDATLRAMRPWSDVLVQLSFGLLFMLPILSSTKASAFLERYEIATDINYVDVLGLLIVLSLALLIGGVVILIAPLIATSLGQKWLAVELFTLPGTLDKSGGTLQIDNYVRAQTLLKVGSGTTLSAIGGMAVGALSFEKGPAQAAVICSFFFAVGIIATLASLATLKVISDHQSSGQ